MNSMSKLDSFATEIKADNAFIKASFGGFAGSGKSRTGAEFVIGAYKLMKLTKPVLFLDNEKGSRFLIPQFAKAGIRTMVKQTVQLADVLEAFKLVQEREVDFLFIDSLTKVWYNFIEQYKAANKVNGKPKAFMTLQDWGKILPDWQQKFAENYIKMNGNCIFTGRGGYTYDMEENEETKKKEFVKSGVKMKMAGETPYEPDLNIWMSAIQEMEDSRPKIWREALILKDRSGLIDGMTFVNPVFEDFRPVIEYILSCEIGEIAGESSQENLAASETYSDKKERREIAIEKIGNEFIKAGFGTANADKQYKVLISEKFFGTSSGTELERKPVELLEGRYEDLRRFMLQWIDVEDRKAYIEGFKFENELPFDK
jgi:hypothetical protein